MSELVPPQQNLVRDNSSFNLEFFTPYIVEFFGTLVILYILFYTRDSPHAPIIIGLTIGATVLLGDLFNQGHFNPLYTLLKFFDGKISFASFGLYLLAQLLACVLCFLFIIIAIYARRILFVSFI